ncbi:MAG: hypothetical protein AAFO69_00855 [Bacteroidota bacterium]
MKIRILGNKLRLRLQQQEIQKLAAGQAVVETVNFPIGDQLHYAVEPVGVGAEVTATFQNSKISVKIPGELLDGWEMDDRVGIYQEMKSAEEAFSIAVEKDFKCLHKRPGEDESGNYPHPLEEK